MIIEILNKILMILYFLSTLNTFRHVYYFIQSWTKSTDEMPVKYVLSKQSLFLLGVSISYVITGFFTGIKL